MNLSAPALACVICLSSIAANAHSWYTGLQSPSGELCCNDRDCYPLADGDVSEVQGGFYVHSLKSFVPYELERPSPDGRYHACFWGGEVKCFFGPEMGS